VALARSGYTSAWAGESGLDVEDAFCVTFVLGMEPREALTRFGLPDDVIRTASWLELRQYAHGLVAGSNRYGAVAAFPLAGLTVVVEENGFRGRFPAAGVPLSQGTETVNVYQNGNGGQAIIMFRQNGEDVAWVDGDDPEIIYRSHPSAAAVTEGLPELIWAALTPDDNSAGPAETFEDGEVDWLQVACNHLGLAPRPEDVSGPVAGAAWRLRLPLTEVMDLEFR
jgi:hypothetical protein